MNKVGIKVSRIDKAYDLFKLFEKAGLFVSGLSLFAAMFLITIDVVVRNFTNLTLVGVYEIVQNYLMPLMVFPAIGYAYSNGIMPRIVMLTEKFGIKARSVIAILISLIEVLIFASMSYFTFGYAVDSVNENLGFICGTRMLPLYHVMFLPVFSFVMITVENVFLLIVNLRNSSDKFSYR